MPSTSDEITPRWFRITIILCTASPDEKLNVAENVKWFWYFPNNKQKHYDRTMVSTIATITSSSKQCFNHNFQPWTVHKRFSDFAPKNSGDRGIPYKHTTWILRWNDVETVVSRSFQRGIYVMCLTFKDSHAWANSADNTITSKWRHNDKNFSFHKSHLNFPSSTDNFFKINILILIFATDFLQFWNRTVFIKNQ